MDINRTALKTAVNNFIYHRIAGIARGIMAAQGLRLRYTGEEHIPATGGAVVVVNHTGYMDFILGGYLPRRKHRLVRYLTKGGIFKVAGVGPLMRVMGHVPVDRTDGSESFRRAVELAKAGELVGIFPEATISRSFEIRQMRTGAVRIAHEAGVPVIPEVIFGSQRLWTKGKKKNLGRSKTPILIEALEPFYPAGDAEADTAELRSRMQAGLERLWNRYEEEFGPMPQGAEWVPARLGGGAPTLEEVEAQDQAVETERYRVRKLREELELLKAKLREASAELVTDLTPGRPVAEVETLTWVKENLNTVVEEAARGLEEGRDKVAELLSQVKAEVSQTQARLSAEGREVFAGSRVEDVLVSAAAQARLITSRLPHRIKTDFAHAPTMVVANEGAFHLEGGQLSERSVQALNDVAHSVRTLVVLSESATELRPAHFEGVPQKVVWLEQADGPWAQQLAAHASANGVQAEEILAFLHSPADESLLNLAGGGHNPAGVTVALEGAPVNLLREATSVTHSAAKEGLAEVLELVAKQHLASA